VPLASWAGILIADVLSRRRPYDEAALFDASGRYGSVDWAAVTTMVVASVIGWGLVVNGFADGAAWNNCQGYLLGPLRGHHRAWAAANLGVLVALVLSFVVTWFVRGRTIRKQEEVAVP